MTGAGVDNSNLALKIALRWRHLPAGKVSVLDCFAGEGVIWSKMRELEPGRIAVDSIEAAKGKGAPTFQGDNRKLLPVLSLADYNVIDLDAYGTPYRQVLAVLQNHTRVPGTIVFYTLNRTVMGRIDNALMLMHDFTEPMIRKTKILCSTWGYRCWMNALAKLGVSSLSEVTVEHGSNVYRYGVFRIPLRKTAK